MRFPEFALTLPVWVEEVLPDPEQTFPGVEDRMRLAIELSRRNVEHGTGGPFGAAIFDTSTKRLLAPGVNLVVSQSCSVVHAEIVAIIIAQQILHSYSLDRDGQTVYELVTSTEPCSMCLGAIVWSGVRGVVCGAGEEEAEAIGFDEGPKFPDWVEALGRRGIPVLLDVCREEAVAVLLAYVSAGGPIYNPRQ